MRLTRLTVQYGPERVTRHEEVIETETTEQADERATALLSEWQERVRGERYGVSVKMSEE